MEKQKLLSFINKYYLNDVADSVIWNVSNGELRVAYKLEDNSLVSEIILKNFNCDDAVFGVYETSQLISLLNILEDDIEIEFGKRGSSVNILHLQDLKTKIKYMLSECDIIPNKPPETVNLPPFDMILKLDVFTIGKFIKASKSMSVVKSFSVNANELIDEIKFIISDTSNVVSLDVATDKVKDCEKLVFSIEHLTNIFSNNKDFESIECEVSSQGLFKIGFNFTDITSIYYLVAEQ